MWNIGGYGFGREQGKANGSGSGSGNGKENGSEKRKELALGTSNRDKTENKAECRTGDHSKALTTLQSDVFLQGHQHTANSYLSTFFDFPTNNQLLMCYINSGFICWRFEHKPSKSFAIPSLQIYPFPVVNENSGSLQPANHVLMITFISGSLECTMGSIVSLIHSFENGKSQEHLNRSRFDGDDQGHYVFRTREVSSRVRDRREFLSSWMHFPVSRSVAFSNRAVLSCDG